MPPHAMPLPRLTAWCPLHRLPRVVRRQLQLQQRRPRPSREELRRQVLARSGQVLTQVPPQLPPPPLVLPQVQVRALALTSALLLDSTRGWKRRGTAALLAVGRSQQTARRPAAPPAAAIAATASLKTTQTSKLATGFRVQATACGTATAVQQQRQRLA